MILPRLVHHAHSKYAAVMVPSLDDWERGLKEKLKAETLKLESVGVNSPWIKCDRIRCPKRTLHRINSIRPFVLVGPNRPLLC